MLKLKLQYFGQMIGKVSSLEKTLMLETVESKRKKGYKVMRWLESNTDSMDLNLSKLRERVEDGGARCAAVYGVTELDET